MESSVIKINNADVEIAIGEPEDIEMSQEQMDAIGVQTKKLMEERLGDGFWDAFDGCLRDASNKVLFGV